MILIYSTLRDPHALVVERALREKLGRRVEIVDLSDFPRLMRLSVRASDSEIRHEIRLSDGTVIDQGEVTAVWWRRPQPFGLHPDVRQADHRRFARSECSSAFNGFWMNSRCLWVNPIEKDRAASRKVHQLDVAREVGLRIPETLITNNPEQVQEFWKQQSGKVIYKAFMGIEEAWRETRLIREDELAFLENVRYAPAIFQEYVPAGADLRITVVGDQIFAAEIDSQSGTYACDVRMDMTVECRSINLPPQVERSIANLMDVFSLEYGAIDMRRTPDGDFVFFEINPAGQYLYIEKLAGLPITRALAEHLACGMPRSPSGNYVDPGPNTYRGRLPVSGVSR